MLQRLQSVFYYIRIQIQEKFLLRWTLANIVGWSVGLYLGSTVLAIFGAHVLPGVILGGAVAGGTAGGFQWLACRGETGWTRRRWLRLSAAGGALAAFPAYVSGVSMVVGPAVGYFVVGAVFGGLFGGMQWSFLREDFHDHAAWWVVANIAAGGLCGCFSMNNPLWLPVFCSLGPVTFGLITGYTLRRLLAASQQVSSFRNDSPAE